jgi:hypothetical protein
MAALLLVSCLGGGGMAPGPPPSNFTDGGCRISCSTVCPGNSVCLPWPYVPSCEVECQSSADCQTGELCVVLTTDGLPRPTLPICVLASRLAVCGGSRPCTPLMPMCQDTQTLLQPLKAAANFCGYEVVACNNGCDAQAARCN